MTTNNEDNQLSLLSQEDEINMMVSILKTNYALKSIYKIMGISEAKAKRKLLNYFECRNLNELRDELGIRRKLSDKRIKKILAVKEIHDKCHTLQKTANQLDITRERVRQILQEGENRGLFEYETSSIKRLNILKEEYDRETLIKKIKEHISPSEICSALEISQSYFSKLLDEFDIDFQEYYNLAKAGKCLNEYTEIVSILGHHPATTELLTRKEWRSVWDRIRRIWGSIEDFRKEFGIERPKYRIHPNTKAAWDDAIKKRTVIKNQKIEKLVNFIKEEGPIGIRAIRKELKLSEGTAWSYVKELKNERQITAVGSGNQVKYKMR